MRKSQELLQGRPPSLASTENAISSTRLTAAPAKIFAFGVQTVPAKFGLARTAFCSGQTATGDGAGLAHHLSELVAGL